MLRLWKMKSVRVIIISAMLLAVYAVLGFVIAPRLLRSALLKDIPEAIAVTPAVGDIRINPFLFQVTVDKFSLTAQGGERLLGFERLFVDFDLSSIWHRAYSFGNIELTAPFVSATVARDGSLNLAQLKPRAPAKPDDKSGPLPAVRIGSFRVAQGSLSYQDHSQTDVFTARLEPINFELHEFTTGVDGGQFKLTAASKLGEKIEWHGHVSIEPLESDGEFRVDGLKVHTVWEYLEDKLNFVVNSGTIDLGATYKLTGGVPGGSPQVQVQLQKVALTDLKVQPKGSDIDWISLPSLLVTGTTVDVAKRHAHVELLSLTGLKVLSWLEPDGSVNLQKLAASPAAVADAASGSPPQAAVVSAPTVSGATAAGAPWQFDLVRFEIRESSLSVEDRTAHPTVKMLLEPFAVQVNGLSQDLSKPLDVMLDTHINGAGSLVLNGEVIPQPIAANFNVKLSGLELTAIQPYIAQRTSLTLLGGRVGADAKVHYGAQRNIPSLSFAGNVNVDSLHTVDNDLHDDFINWERLDIKGMTLTQSPDRLDITEIAVRKPYARVIIESDESLNVKHVLMAPGAAAASPAPPAAVPVAKAKPDTSRAGAAAANAPGMPISVKRIVIEAGQANFADLSVKPNFSTGVQNLRGSITNISSKADSRAKVNLLGEVDTYSPVTINGEFNVLGPKLYTDIGLGFHNIELTVFNPYSGKFAGYNISKGKLTTDLHYKVDDRKLEAEHHIVVEQLEFGDKTASKDAVSLPIKLAVALLKDRNGVIDLSVPVTGTLDDPQFRLGPIIWKVFVNILEKAVTAPFALLGSLFGGGPDVQFIDFQPGSASLDATAADKAKAVAKALLERPQLKMEVPIAVVPELDRPVLVAARLDAEISAAQAAKAGTKKAAAAPVAYSQLEPAAQLELLSPLYAKEMGGEPKYPEAVTSIKTKPEMSAAKVQFLHDALRDHIQVDESELHALGQQRAQAVQAALLADPQVSADRVFLVANDKAVAKDGVVRAELTLQ